MRLQRFIDPQGDQLTLGHPGSDAHLVNRKVASIALQLAALVAVLVWLGRPGPFFGLLVASVAVRYWLSRG